MRIKRASCLLAVHGIVGIVDIEHDESVAVHSCSEYINQMNARQRTQSAENGSGQLQS